MPHPATPAPHLHRLCTGVLLALLPLAGTAAAGGTERACDVPAELLYHNPPLHRVHKALAEGRLDILILGTGSTAGAGTSDSQHAYPERLRQHLADAHPGLELHIQVASHPGQTAQQLQRILPTLLRHQTDLVIWQTGSADAARKLSLQSFGQAISTGLRSIRNRGADVILMDMQYAPYTLMMADFNSYRGYLWWKSRQEDVGLLPRYQIMEYWYEQGRFDLATDDPAQQRANADAIHDCLGQLLATMTTEGAAHAAPAGDGAGQAAR